MFFQVFNSVGKPISRQKKNVLRVESLFQVPNDISLVSTLGKAPTFENSQALT